MIRCVAINVTIETIIMGNKSLNCRYKEYPMNLSTKKEFITVRTQQEITNPHIPINIGNINNKIFLISVAAMSLHEWQADSATLMNRVNLTHS